ERPLTSTESETPSSAATPVATGLRDGVALGVAKLLAALLAGGALKALLRVTDETDYGRYSTFLLVSNFAIAFTSWPTGSVLRLGSNEWVGSQKVARTFLLHALLVVGAAALLAAPMWQARDTVDRYVTVPGATWIILGYAVVTGLANVTAAVLKPAGRGARLARPREEAPRRAQRHARLPRDRAAAARGRAPPRRADRPAARAPRRRVGELGDPLRAPRALPPARSAELRLREPRHDQARRGARRGGALQHRGHA